MTATRLLIALTFLGAGGAAAAVDTELMHGLSGTRYHEVDSERVGRTFRVFVNVPAGAVDGARYPTLYLLDGGGLFPLLSAYYRYLHVGEEIPDAIIVGIGYPGPTFEDGNFRSTDFTAPAGDRDYWGGAGNFQAFLADELLPFIEQRYPADASRRVIVGQSLGGQFVLYTALTRPGLFWGHVASNPALHRNLPFFLAAPAATDAPTGSKLFVASATGDDPQFREPALQWIAHWTSREAIPWTLKTVDLPGHNHMSAPPAAFRLGMRWLFLDD